MTKKRKTICITIFAYMLALLFLVPIFWMLIVALKPEGNSAVTLSEWFRFSNLTLDNFKKVMVGSDILKWTYNSMVISVISTVLSLLMASLAAFAFSKLNFRFKKSVYLIISLGLMIPMEAMVIPLYDVTMDLNLVDNIWGVILPGLTNPLGIILLKQFMDGVPNEYIEAARLDGCGPFRMWLSLCIPLTKSSMVAVGIFNFLLAWNNFLWPFICITSGDKMVLSTGVPTFVSSNMNVVNTIMTASAIAAIPAMIVFLLLQKQIIQGVSMSGVKG